MNKAGEEVASMDVPVDRYIYFATEDAEIDVPIVNKKRMCRNGCCTTCAVKVLEGKVRYGTVRCGAVCAARMQPTRRSGVLLLAFFVHSLTRKWFVSHRCANKIGCIAREGVDVTATGMGLLLSVLYARFSFLGRD